MMETARHVTSGAGSKKFQAALIFVEQSVQNFVQHPAVKLKSVHMQWKFLGRISVDFDAKVYY